MEVDRLKQDLEDSEKYIAQVQQNLPKDKGKLANVLNKESRSFF